VARVLALPQWFNPFAWWAVRNFDEGAEWACDEAARRACPEDTPAYGRALLALGAGQATLGLLNPAAHGRGLALRIRRRLVS
jgi:beta-lactamase regulating signal transducer with metallopeptidase domain